MSGKADEPLPKFLDDPTAAKFMATLAADPDRRRRLLVELLARTGMRAGELGGVRDDAMYRVADRWWLRIPVGKLHDDRTVPLHPLLVGLIGDYQTWRGPSWGGYLLERDDGHRFDRRTIHRYVMAVARRAGIPRVHPHQLRHTLATQCLNRGMSLEAIAALLGHYAGDPVKGSHLRPSTSTSMVCFRLKIGESSSEPAEAPLLCERAALAESNRDVWIADLDRSEKLGNPAGLYVLELEDRREPVLDDERRTGKGRKVREEVGEAAVDQTGGKVGKRLPFHDSGELVAVEDAVVTAPKHPALGRRLLVGKAPRIALTGVDGDEQLGATRRSPGRDTRTRACLCRRAGGLPQDHLAAPRRGEHELRAVLAASG
jgi:hypothetical protein